MTRTVSILGTRGYPSYYGGFETAVRFLAPHLADNGWEVTVYCRPGATLENDPGRHDGVRTVYTAGLESKSISTLSFGLTSALSAMFRRPDVALVMNVANGYWLPLLKLSGTRTVVNVDGIEWERAKWGRVGRAVFLWGAKLTARFADELVFDAREIGSYWERTFGRSGTFIPYGGTVPPALPVQEGLTHRGYILVVARFVPENTIPEFLTAARELGRRHTVVIVGSSGYGGPLEDEVRRLTEDLPTVRWLGHVSDDQRLHSLWQHAGVYFHGHSVGGTNPALVQAMACGAPTVARDTVYNREVLEDTGLFVPADPCAIVDVVDQLMKNPRCQEHLAQAAQSRSLSSYSWEAVNSAYDTVLRGTAKDLG